MPTQAEIARSFGVSRAYICKLVKQGMPLTSFEDARLWRESHARSKNPTDDRGLARLVAEERDDDSPEARARRKKFFEDKADGTLIPAKESLEDALHGSIEVLAEARRLLLESMIENKESKISPRLHIHNKALEGRIKAEEAVVAALEHRRTLIPLTEAMDMARKGYQIIISRLSSLPQNMAPRVNPHDPHHAMDLLQSECTTIISDAQKAFAA